MIFVSLIILGFYTSLSEENQINIIKNPSISKYEELNSKYPSILYCPCSTFSMSYGRIISLSTRYHSICSSEFLEDYWLSYFTHTDIDVMTTDFRFGGLSFFNLIKILCETSKQTIDHAITAFRTNRLVTMNVVSSKKISSKIQTRLELFQQRTISSFVHLIQLIRSAIQTNQLAEDMVTNLGPLEKYDNESSTWSFRFRPRDFYTNNCSCLMSNECTRPVGFYILVTNATRAKPNVAVPGLVLGCYTIDSLLLSTLECFYNQNCIKLLIDNYDFDAKGLLRPLDDRAIRIQSLSINNSRFSSNTTIGEIFSQLFVEEWINSTNYTSYYARCKPLECTYTLRKRFHIAYMLAIMLGFCGGLSAILEIILPPIVKLIMRQKTKRNHTNTITTGKRIVLSTILKYKYIYYFRSTNHFTIFFFKRKSLFF